VAKYRNQEERVYIKVRKPLANMHEYAMANLETAEERYADLRGTGGISEANAWNAREGLRRDVSYLQKLLDAVTACEPAICRGEEVRPAPEAFPG